MGNHRAIQHWTLLLLGGLAAAGLSPRGGHAAPVPTVTAPPTEVVAEGSLLSFTVTASSSSTILTFTASPLPAGASFATNAANTSGTFSWTPSCTQAGPYSVGFYATNSVGTGADTTRITVTAVNCPPVVTAPATRVVNEGALLSFTVTASDPDGETITSLTAAPLPPGATFTSNASHTSGTFNWTPSYSQAGSYGVTFTASNTLSGSASTGITVLPVDRPPVVTAPSTASGQANHILTFTVSASDPDGDAIASLTAAPLPTGASLTVGGGNTSGTFSWTPATAQTGTFSVTFTASNALSGSATTAITISADNAPVVTAPATVHTWEFGQAYFTVAASDPDGDALTSLTATPLPTGASFTKNASNTSGTFSWQPSYTQAGTYTVTFTASNAVSGSAATTITVDPIDRPPVVVAPATAGGNENTLITFTVTASDADGDAITSLTAAPLPSGATFSPNPARTSGTFGWTPSYAQAGAYSVTFTASNAGGSGSATTAITVNNVDRAPTVTAPATQTGTEAILLSFTVTASDPDAQAITSLTAAPLPTGATFASGAGNTSGTFSWIPDYSQAGSYSVTFTATNALSGSAATTITIADANRAPAITVPASVAGAEGSPVSVTATASDPDGQNVTLWQNNNAPFLAGPASAGPTLSPGITLTGTPSYSQAGTYTVHWSAADVNVPPDTTTATTTITIGNTDAPPVVAAPDTLRAAEGRPVAFVVTVSDPDGDAIVSLTAAPLPVGASFTADAPRTSATFEWTPTYTQAGTYPVVFTASNALAGRDTTVIVIGPGSPPPAGSLFGLVDTGELFRSTDGGVTWVLHSTLPVHDAVALAAESSPLDLYILSRSGSLFRSNDGGSSWHAIGALPAPDLVAFTIRFDGTFLALTETGTLFRSSDRGATFTALAALTGSSWVSLLPGPLGRLYALTRTGEVYESQDAGTSWTAVGAMSVSNAVAIQRRDAELHVLTATGELYRSINYGRAWLQEASITAYNMQAAAEVGGGLLAAAETGEIYASATGKSWSVVGTINQLRVRALGSDTPLAVGVAVEEKAPRFVLRAPYPNPSSLASGATFRMQLPQADRVRLELYDVQGRLVGSHDEAMLPAGPTAIRWQPRGVAGGTYYVRIRTGTGHTATRAWTLIP